ncbi:MAG TPA: hypothetical protein VJJ47_00750, partial [Candidatus Paceibacterota bacterium]
MLVSATGFDPLAGVMPAAAPATSTAAALPVATNDGVPAAVRAYWADEPIMVKVASCESNFRQFGEDGQPLLGWANPEDIGVMQINRKAHAAKAKALGLDLGTLEGNLAFARHLHRTQGLAPWVYSKHCWSP